MAYIVTGSDGDLHASMHGLVTRDDLSFVKRLSDRVSSRGPGEVGSKYLQASKQIFENFDFAGMRDRVRSMRDRFMGKFEADDIAAVMSIATAQNARPKMRRYLMAMPRLRTLYSKGRVEGYGELYEDEDPTVQNEQYGVYREVNNGAYVPTEDEDRWITHFGIDDENGLEELSQYEKVIIRQGWSAISDYLDENDEDPTSLVGAKL